MRDDKLEVSVSFEEKRGYFTTGSELPQRLTALSLGGLRRRIEVALLPDEPVVQLRLDRVARLERDRHRRACALVVWLEAAHPRRSAWTSRSARSSVTTLKAKVA
jgi:hypothetical protein